MTGAQRTVTCGVVAGLLLTPILISPVSALPTMIRLGYADCAACHLSPQGGGLLNDYGRGIDQAQSLRGGEYEVPTDGVARALSLGGRITQDVRMVMPLQDRRSSGESDATFRLRLAYRNVTAVSQRLRFSGALMVETDSVQRPARAYDPAVEPASVFVNTALVHYRVNDRVEVAAGRDQLPVGLNLPDPDPFFRSRSRFGTYDVPTQAKVFVNTRRLHLTPFVYSSSRSGQTAEREAGAGTVAEFDLLGRQKTIVGGMFLRASAASGERRTLGMYARLGFGPWGVLAEHDVTDRTRDAAPAATFRQSATYAQVFWAAREWLVASALGERLRVATPFEERLDAVGVAITARLSSQATVGLSARREQDGLTGRHTRSVTVQATFKTVP